MKKVRVTIPEDIWRIMKNDIEEFGINNNKLCNYILEQLKYTKEINIEKDLETQGRPLKKIIQFDLNVANKKIYYEVLKDNHVDVEAEFFRELFEVYCSKFKYIRELFIFQDMVKTILDAIQNKKKLKIRYGSVLTNIEPYFLKRDEQGDENYLFAYSEIEKKYLNYKLKDLEVITILNEKIKGKDKKYIDSVRKNFDPFLGNGNFIKVRLSQEGQKLLKGLTNYRPKLIEKNEEIYIFEASNENAKLYFRQFSKEAIILEPLSLREEMREDLLKTLENY